MALLLLGLWGNPERCGVWKKKLLNGFILGGWISSHHFGGWLHFSSGLCTQGEFGEGGNVTVSIKVWTHFLWRRLSRGWPHAAKNGCKFIEIKGHFARANRLTQLCLRRGILPQFLSFYCPGTKIWFCSGKRQNWAWWRCFTATKDLSVHGRKKGELRFGVFFPIFPCWKMNGSRRMFLRITHNIFLICFCMKTPGEVGQRFPAGTALCCVLGDFWWHLKILEVTQQQMHLNNKTGR